MKTLAFSRSTTNRRKWQSWHLIGTRRNYWLYHPICVHEPLPALCASQLQPLPARRLQISAEVGPRSACNKASASQAAHEPRWTASDQSGSKQAFMALMLVLRLTMSWRSAAGTAAALALLLTARFAGASSAP